MIALLRELVSERRCPLCAELMTADDSFCDTCQRSMPAFGGSCCSRCGEVILGDGGGYCASCLVKEPLFGRLVFHGLYQDSLRDSLLRLKHGEVILAEALGRLVAKALGEMEYDLVVPVPLHPRRLCERGFNQALELARPICAKSGSGLEANLLRKTRETPVQAGLDIAGRSRNLRDVFEAQFPCHNQRILLVDDVATTCATVREAARVLLQAGARSVDVAVVARTPHR